MATVFDVFKEVRYTYLTIAQSQIKGDVITNEQDFMGIFKNKSGVTQSRNMEVIDSKSTLHVHPSDFNIGDCKDLIGNGIRINGVEYSIVGATAGMNFDTGVIEHYRLTLQNAQFVGSSKNA